ncbi:thioredoxin family protein [Porphyrobacter sp. YT40]|uniref:protein-disulfide reductase DsbD family protein n=1 Tax=Porphyrobacter sp. YT40 TaxID=2547601 RepID=UPI00114384B0|nr:thioredoxin family protein [Porphyrobacter sp. YT40]QDH36140.1 thiol:disulfide interchange protein [Porphyrobacter sp. YT40]
MLAAPAIAQEGTPAPRAPLFGSDRIAVALYAQGQPVAGEEWLLALHFTPSAPEWHGYWSNPGDAGEGMRLALDLPPDWEVGEARYPVPQRLVLSGLMNHIYEGPYTILVPVVPGPSAAGFAGPVTGTVDYLACSDICVPQHADLAARAGGDFARWRAAIAPPLDAAGRFAIEGKTLRIAIPLPASMALPDPHVFVANQRLVAHAAPQTFRRVGDVLVAEIPLDDFGTGKADALEGILAFGDGIGVRFAAELGPVPSGGEPVAGPRDAPSPALWTLILGALAGGLLLNIMPCVFPILSLKAIALARAGESEAKARAEGLAYTAGVVLACLGLGALLLALRAGGEQIGWAFQLQEPGVVVALLVLAAAITANFAGLFDLPAVSVRLGGERMGAFATGLLAAFVATPCTGPFMAAALGAALLLPVPQALLLFACLGLGLALPFLLLGFVPPLRRMLPRPGAWMERFRRIMAIPMALTALALLWLTVQLGGRPFGLIALVLVAGVVLGLFVTGRLQRAGKLAWPAFGLVAAPFLAFALIGLPSVYEAPSARARESILAAQPFSREALADARASGQPVFLYFTADWCVTCKVNEAAAIERETTRAAFEQAGVTVLVGDWTARDEAITAFLTEQGAAGVPLYLWYAPNAAKPEQLPQVLTPDLLAARASGDR